MIPVGRERLYPALAWVCDAGGAPFGSATLVGPRQLLTCAHVVASALGKDADGPAPADPVRVRFTHAGDPALRTALVHPGGWFPPGATDGDPGQGDIAILDLQDDPPAAAAPVGALGSGTRPGEVVAAFGLPARHGADSGGWASGELAGIQASGWIQIDSPAEGYRIQPGFSGGAAWSDAREAVVGMVVAAESSPDTRVAWMVPAELLAARWPALVTGPTPVRADAPVPTGPRVIKVANRPAPVPMGDDVDDDAREVLQAQWLQAWFNETKIVVNLGAADEIAQGDYFDVLAKHEPVEDDDGKVIGFVDEPGSLVRAVEVQDRFSVCQLESFAYKTFYEFVLPARLARLGLHEDDDVEESVIADLMALVVAGEVVKPIPSAEKDARDEVEDLYSRSLDDDLAPDEKQQTYRDMVRRADRFLMRFPSGYFAEAMLYQKGYALIMSGEYQDALDTFELYRRRHPFGSTEGAERYIAEAKAALRGDPARSD